ncbi:hypothetical protein TRIUR3_16535 [Triticum urartu]|uniref:Uncharacterized protein n=1 Tax=Triticum urartu TaxID=4572 RepID=M7ZDW0_TRIUA|nr:hypothetical protein TRIUR3_16535 [Triticum urartu]
MGSSGQKSPRENDLEGGLVGLLSRGTWSHCTLQRTAADSRNCPRRATRGHPGAPHSHQAAAAVAEMEDPLQRARPVEELPTAVDEG